MAARCSRICRHARYACETRPFVTLGIWAGWGVGMSFGLCVYEEILDKYNATPMDQKPPCDYLVTKQKYYTIAGSGLVGSLAGLAIGPMTIPISACILGYHYNKYGTVYNPFDTFGRISKKIARAKFDGGW